MAETEDTQNKQDVQETVNVPAQENVQEFDPISDGNRAEQTSVEIDLDKTLNEYFAPKQTYGLENIYDIKYFWDKMGDRRDEIDEYEMETGSKVVDYMDEYDRTINNTGTALDGKTIDEVACSKQASPKEIWDTKDVLEQFSYGVYEFLRNSTNLVARGVVKAIGPEGFPEPTAKELQESNIADFGESPEAKSIAGDIIKPISQFSSGAVAVSGFASLAGGTKLSTSMAGAAKTKWGASLIAGTFALMKVMATESIAFSENSSNFSELCKSFGINISNDLLVKNPEDSFFAKKLKNAVDGGMFQIIMNGLVGSAKVFSKSLQKTPEYAKGFSPEIKQMASGLQKESQQQLKNIQKVGKAYGDAAVKAATKVKSIISEEQLDAATETVRGLSSQEKDKIYKGVMSDLANEVGEEAGERISKVSLKNTNKKLYDAVVYYKEKEILEGSKIANQAADFVDEIARGNKNETEITNFALEKLEQLITNRNKTIETASGAAQSVAEISKSDVAKRMNKLLQYAKDNADKIDSRKLIDLFAALKNPEEFDAFFGITKNVAEHGLIERFFDKINFVRQNIMLASGITQLKDISSTLMFRVSQWGDTATATGIKNVFVKPYRAIKGKFTKPDLISAKIRLGMGEIDDVYLKEVADNITGMGEFISDVAKHGYRKMTGQLRAGEINPVARHMKQVGASASKYNLQKTVQMDVIPFKDPLSQTINKVINHSGIYVSEAKDDFVQAMLHQADIRTEIGSMARRALRSGEITKDQMDDYIRDYLTKSESWQRPTTNKIFDFVNGITPEAKLDSIMKRAAESSSISTFRSPLTGATKELYDVLQSSPYFRIPLRLIAPFQKTGMVISIERGIKERSIFTFLNPNLYRAISHGGREGQMAVARLANGLLVQSAIAWNMWNGNIIGPMPKNRGERELLQAAGATEYSVKVGDKYYSLTDVAGPYGPLIKQTLAITDSVIQYSIDADENPENENRLQDSMINIAAVFAQSPLMTTMYGGILENAERGDPIGLKNVIRSFATGPRIINEVQSGVSRIADSLGIDTDVGRDARYQKQATSFLDRLQTNWGGEGNYRYDLFGMEMKAPSMSFVTMMSSDSENNPVVAEMLDRKAFVQSPSNTFEYEGVTIPLKDSEVNDWRRIMGEINTFGKMYDFINSREYKSLPDSKYNYRQEKQYNKTSALQRKYNEMKKKAAKKLIDTNPEIGLRYKAAKESIPTINLNPYMEMIK